MIKQELLELAHNNLEGCSIEELYEAVLKLTQKHMTAVPEVQGERTVYYMSAEFLIGKLLSNNLMNLNIYDEVASVLSEAGRSLAEVEEYEPEPSLGNGGLGRLAACFMDSIATLGIHGQGLGLVYHYGLFKQVFENNRQTETKDTWLDKPTWLRKTDFTTQVQLGDVNVVGRMYEIDVLGSRGTKAPLRLFDLESVDEQLVEKGINFNQEALDKNLTLFLYPDDSTEQGLRLRFAQQYFMVKSGLDWILHEHQGHLANLQDYATIQINDTHPSMVVVLLMKELLKAGVSFADAVKVVSETCAYTNHTILAEALEKWPLAYFEGIDAELVPIIHELDKLAKTRSMDPKTFVLDAQDKVHMASLAIHFSKSTNGVAALHTDILKNSELKEFYALYPERFNNKTNGITFRRWLTHTNRPLTRLITSLIGDAFKVDAMELEKLGAYVDNEDILKQLLDIKVENKAALAHYIEHLQGDIIDPNAIFDIQIKRLHEYKRQQLNLLYAIDYYFKIKQGFKPKRKLVMFFGSKAAPAYIMAKDIIHALLAFSKIVADDKEVSQWLQIVFVENYNVSKAEMLIPACDISEQISLASKEASGTGNMKFMLNGALTLGTMDGANVEIAELVGEDNIYIFGESSDTIIEHYDNADYVSRKFYEENKQIKQAVDFIHGDLMLKYGHKENLERLFENLVNKDWFMTLIDFDDYVAVKQTMLDDYEDRLGWAQKTLVNISKAGFFSSDRTIEDYNNDIWKV